MKPRLAVLLLISVAFGTTPGFAETWAKFRDDTEKCRLVYPSSVFTTSSTDEENYQRFSGPEGDTYFRILALENEDHLTPAEIKAEYIKKKGTKDLVYDRSKKDFLVLSGFQGRLIFYTKIALSSDNETICVLHISYPRKAKRAFDAIVTRMSRSFSAAK